MPRFALLLFLSLQSSVACRTAFAQSAAITGIVVDPSNAAIPNVKIVLTNVKTQTTVQGKTNGSGAYSLPFVQPGVYTLAADTSGFKHYEKQDITVTVAQNLELDVRMQLGDASQSVTVDGSGINIDTADATVSTVVDHQFVENIPLNGRSFQSLVTAVPGVIAVPSSGVAQSGEFTVNGQRTESNYFMVDGVSANTGAAPGGAGSGAGFSGNTPGVTVLGTTQSLISIDALQEFRASTSTYSAEYGRTPGGQFSFETRSGTNAFHGSLYDYFRNDALDSNNWFNGYLNAPAFKKQPERQNDFGGTFGGPVWIPGAYRGKDKTFFFFSYEGLRLTVPTASQRYAVPSMRLREEVTQRGHADLRKVLDAFPIPTNPNEDQAGVAYFAGGYSAPSRLNATSIRVDHSFSDRFKIFARYGYNPSNGLSRSGGLSEVDSSTRNVQTITVGTTNLIGPHSTNQARFNFTDNNATSDSWMDSYGGAKPYGLGDLPGLTNRDWYGFYFFLAERNSYFIGPNQARQRQINVVDSLSTTFGRHSLKFGIDYRRLANYQSVPSIYEWSWAFDENVILNDDFDTVALYRYTMPVKPVYTNFSAYVQDEWRATPKLNLSVGVRWDVNPAPKDADGNNPYTVDQITDLRSTRLAPKGTELWKTTYGNFAPRVGLAYQVHQLPGWETVVRAGAGLFYDTGTVNASSGYTDIGSVFRYFTTGPFPASQQTVSNVPAPNVDPPYNVLVNAFDPHLKLPRTMQWNAALQQSLGQNQSLTLTYVGAAGRKLLMPRQFDVGALGNPNFLPGASSSLILTQNGGTSNYDALQVQFQKKMSHGIQTLLSYSWSHSNDTSSSNFATAGLKADSDFDVRNNFQAAITYDAPNWNTNAWTAYPLKHWSLDSRITARSALPVDVTSGLSALDGTGLTVSYHPNRVASQPLYLYDDSFPGRRQINPNAYEIAVDGSGNNIEGNAGRNSARGFDAVQTDFAIRREFPIHEGFGLQFRAEAFNIFNHPVMGSINNALNSGNDSLGRSNFGQAYNTLNSSLGGLNPLYQVGGPRSMQVAIKLHF